MSNPADTLVRPVQSGATVRVATVLLLIATPAIALAKPPVKKRPPPAPPVAAPPAPAEPAKPGTWKTTAEVVLRKKPGERQAVVTKLPEGTAVEVLREEGRWVLVRVGGDIGYLTRTTIVDTTPPPSTLPEPAIDPITTQPVPSRRWSSARSDESHRGASGLFVGVTAKTALRAEARDDAESLAEVTRGDRLAVIDASNPGWIQVRTLDGRSAWIARDAVDDGTARVVLAEVPTTAITSRTASVRPIATAPTSRGLAIRIDAELGYRSLAMDFTSNGTTGLANYVMSADAAAAGLEIEAVKRLSKRLFVGADGRVHSSTSTPGSGIAYGGPSRIGGSIPFSTFASDAGLRVGMHARRVFDVALRAGFHYDAFVTRDVGNAGRLPREHLVGSVVGARIEIAPPRSRVNVSLRFDALVLGARAQTTNLEDGEDSTARATWAGATLRIPLGHTLSLQSTFDFARATTSWTGMSVRTPGTTAATRVDSTQTVWLGVAAEL